jgi:hypothetical protein
VKPILSHILYVESKNRTHRNFPHINLGISKVWVRFGINTQNSSLLMLFVEYVFFKNLNFKILLQKFSNFQIPKMAQKSPEIFSSLALKGEAVGVAQISPCSGGGT